MDAVNTPAALSPTAQPSLDGTVRSWRAVPGRGWGAPAALAVPLLAFVLGALVSAFAALASDAEAVILTTGSAGLAVATAGLVTLLVRRAGGWREAIGWALPTVRDVPRILGWSLLLFLAQILAFTVVRLLVPSTRTANPDNTEFLLDESGLGLIALALVVVVAAPVIEEVLFRGVMLRGLMRRLGFWPAAVISSALFGLLHSEALDADSLLLVVATAVLGLGLCLLVRRTGSIAVGIGVHAVRNAAALSLALLVA